MSSWLLRPRHKCHMSSALVLIWDSMRQILENQASSSFSSSCYHQRHNFGPFNITKQNGHLRMLIGCASGND